MPSRAAGGTPRPGSRRFRRPAERRPSRLPTRRSRRHSRHLAVALAVVDRILRHRRCRLRCFLTLGRFLAYTGLGADGRPPLVPFAVASALACLLLGRPTLALAVPLELEFRLMIEVKVVRSYRSISKRFAPCTARVIAILQLDQRHPASCPKWSWPPLLIVVALVVLMWCSGVSRWWRWCVR